MFGLVGAALDYSRANDVQSGLQGALDAAVLAGAANASVNRDRVAFNYFSSNVVPRGSTVATPTFNLDNNGIYSGSVTAAVPTTVLAVFSIKSLHVSVQASAVTRPGVPPCFIALDPNSADAVQFADGNVTTDCI
jgi:Flp pilus assembly protein TadG